MLPRFLIYLLGFFLEDRSHNRGRRVAIKVDPGAIGVLITFNLLPTEHFHVLRRTYGDCKLILVHLDVLESFSLQNVSEDRVVEVIEVFLH